MFRIPVIFVLSALTAGCATGIQRDLPRCDGQHRRPLNIGLWHPEDPDLARQMAEATGSKVLFSPVETTPAVSIVAKSYAPVEQASAPAPIAALEASTPTTPALSC